MGDQPDRAGEDRRAPDHTQEHLAVHVGVIGKRSLELRASSKNRQRRRALEFRVRIVTENQVGSVDPMSMDATRAIVGG
jgi:hypothetical protein